jgi:hypothetical protein
LIRCATVGFFAILFFSCHALLIVVVRRSAYPGQQTGHGPLPSYACPRLQVFKSCSPCDGFAAGIFGRAPNFRNRRKIATLDRHCDRPLVPPHVL